MSQVSFNVEGQVADAIGVEWNTEFVNKPTNEAQAVAKILGYDPATAKYVIAQANTAYQDYAFVMKAATATAPRVEVLKKKGVRVSKKVGTGVTLTPHCFVKVDANNELAVYVVGTDLDPMRIVGQYNQHANKIADAATALGNATAGEIVYIDWLVRTASKA